MWRREPFLQVQVCKASNDRIASYLYFQGRFVLGVYPVTIPRNSSKHLQAQIYHGEIRTSEAPFQSGPHNLEASCAGRGSCAALQCIC